MNDLLNGRTDRRMLDLFLILLLLCVFMVCSLIIVMIGANSYKSIASNMDSNFDLRIPLSYIGTKVRQNDSQDAVHLIQKEGTQILILDTVESGITYETWIYKYGDALYEVSIEKGTAFALEDGMAILPIQDLQLTLASSGLLEITSSDKAGDTLTLAISLRSRREVAL